MVSIRHVQFLMGVCMPAISSSLVSVPDAELDGLPIQAR